MTREEAIEQLGELRDVAPIETEYAHGAADSILLALLRSNGFQDVAKAWVAIKPK